jgi:hypothetical protein
MMLTTALLSLALVLSCAVDVIAQDDEGPPPQSQDEAPQELPPPPQQEEASQGGGGDPGGGGGEAIASAPAAPMTVDDAKVNMFTLIQSFIASRSVDGVWPLKDKTGGGGLLRLTLVGSEVKKVRSSGPGRFRGAVGLRDAPTGRGYEAVFSVDMASPEWKVLAMNLMPLNKPKAKAKKAAAKRPSAPAAAPAAPPAYPAEPLQEPGGGPAPGPGGGPMPGAGGGGIQ